MNWLKSHARPGLVVGLVLLAGLYFIQLARPLHLEWDSICYLQVAERAAEGRGYSCPGCNRIHCPILYPPGYPLVLASLMRAGMASGTSFVVVNLACIAISLILANELWRREFEIDGTTRLGLAIIFLLWWPVFRLANSPLSEFVFLATAMASVFAAVVAVRAPNPVKEAASLFVAAILAAVAFKVRTVGVALGPVLLWAIVGRPDRLAWLTAQFKARRTAIITAGVALAAPAAWVISKSQYVTGDLATQYGRGGWGMLLRTWGFRLTEFGELTINAPAGKMPTVAQPVISVIGLLAVVGLAGVLWRRRRVLGPADMFVVGVAAIMAVWPFKDARFWVPVLPILLGLVAWGAREFLTRPSRGAPATIFVFLFVMVGIAGEVYNTRLSLSGNNFPLRFVDDYLGPAYRQAWGIKSPSDSTPVDSTVLHMIQRFEPRARRP